MYSQPPRLNLFTSKPGMIGSLEKVTWKEFHLAPFLECCRLRSVCSFAGKLPKLRSWPGVKGIRGSGWSKFRWDKKTKPRIQQQSSYVSVNIYIYLAYIYTYLIYKLVHYIHTCISIYVTSLFITVIELAINVPHCTVIFLGFLTATQMWYHGICFEIHPRDMTSGTVKLTQQGRVPGKVEKPGPCHTPEWDQSTGVYTSAKADNYRSIFTKFGVATVSFMLKPATYAHQPPSNIHMLLLFLFILFFRRF